MEKNPAIDATVSKAKKEVREIWTAELLMKVLANPEMAGLLNSLTKTMKV